MRVNNVTFVINTYPSKERDTQLLNTLKSIYLQTYKQFTILLVENFKDTKKIDSFLSFTFPNKKNIKIINDPKKGYLIFLT